MIDKVIHYCWFGGSPIPEDLQRCIDSWKKFCPDYKIVRWDESNYDVHKNQYMSDAYKEKKWSFVSDYARLDVIYQYGGIYLDTDVELVKSLDDFLKYDMFCGFEGRDDLMDKYGITYEESVNFGLGYGAIKRHPILESMLDYYEELSFYNEDGTLNFLACPAYQTEVLRQYGLTPNREFQQIQGCTVFPAEVFSPKSYLTGKIVQTPNTVSIHHFKVSWTSEADQKALKESWEFFDKYGYFWGRILLKIKRALIGKR